MCIRDRPKKALKPNRSHPKKALPGGRAERGTEEIKNIDAELDEAARQRILDQTTKKKPLTENLKKKFGKHCGPGSGSNGRFRGIARKTH